ncbi:uncharacterized protein DSM5745_07506 [Aspergillus mulundensis]|uniref:Cytochrome P450 n=1 Tax=Aspergillus mulundensis TaxID=1810919 RepID=A0A3D8REQ2_9EURO|nr:hypothetical protein DSM5745_07506 [Aspergillus mulundensis]RDW72334.1 hypothetical protein DSM5745_07506 [Aspergillus mulundensis]
MVVTPMLQPHLQKYLPKRLYARIDLAIYGWEFRRKDEVHGRLGKTFALVTLDECTLVADPALASAILQRRKDFHQPAVVEKVMGIFGSNIVTVSLVAFPRDFILGADAKRKWKLVQRCDMATPAQNDRTEFQRKYLANGVERDLSASAGNAILHAATSWKPNSERAATADPRSFAQTIDEGKNAYFETILLVAEMLLEAALIPAAVLKLWFMPARLQLLGRRKEKMPAYTRAVLDMERRAAGEEPTSHRSFLKMLVGCAEEAKGASASDLFLTDDEISGNLFIFSVAGFETTANTMGYAVMLLAVYPKWQTWMREDIQHLPLDPSVWKYDEVFPKSTRILAVMFETLRLFTAVMHATRSVAEPQQVAGAASTSPHLLLPPMDIFISMQIIHADRDLWGPDCADFKPSRWIDGTGQLVTPPKGTFMPWSGGPRVCPGMKMAQVEFVAALAVLFRSVRCDPVPLGGEDLDAARRRLRGLMRDPVAQVSLQIRDPNAVVLRWSEIGRGSGEGRPDAQG